MNSAIPGTRYLILKDKYDVLRISSENYGQNYKEHGNGDIG